MQPQVFDLLVHLLKHHDHVVSRDDLIALVWGGRIVSDSTLDSRINAARNAVGDNGKDQRLIRTIPRKGIRFIGAVCRQPDSDPPVAPAREDTRQPKLRLSLPDRPAIAVLPFDNMSGDQEQDYFSDGISEDIITGLSKLRWFFVIARNSSFTYKGKAVHIRQVAAELGVRYVVEGSVRKTAIVCASPRSSTTRRPAAMSGRNTTTATCSTCSACRTKSPTPSSWRSSHRSMPRKIFTAGASRPTMWTRGTC